jgi:hypothetical protein
VRGRREEGEERVESEGLRKEREGGREGRE